MPDIMHRRNMLQELKLKNMNHNLIMIGIGCLLGFLFGLFSVGGSSIATPILRLMDIPPGRILT